MNKLDFSSIAIILTVLFGCVSKPLQIPLRDKNFYEDVSSIGIYIIPSGNDRADRILYNVLCLDIMNSGYDVADLNSFPDESKSSDQSSNLKGSHRRIIDKIQSGALKNRIDDSGIDALYVVSSKWKNFPVFYRTKKSRQYFETENKSLKLSITTFDASTLEIMASSTRLDTTVLYLEKAAAARFDKGEDFYGFPYYPEPVYVLIQKCIDFTVGKIPINTKQDTIIAKYNYPVLFYVDEKYRDIHKEQWKTNLERRLLYVNDIFRRQFDAEFYIEDFKEWHTGDVTSLDLLSKKLLESTSYVKDKFIIGVTFDNGLRRNWTDRHEVGTSIIYGNHIVIKDVPSFPGVTNWDAIEEELVITHELGHSFGAPHVLDPSSIMYPEKGEYSYLFDPLNSKFLQLNIPKKLKPQSVEDYHFNIAKVAEYYRKSEKENIQIVPLLSWLLSKEYFYFVGLDTSVLDSGNLQLQDSSIFYAVDGYRDYEKADWKTALTKFEKALEFNSEMPEIYVYCSRIYERLGEIEKYEYYKRLAEEMGYSFIGM